MSLRLMGLTIKSHLMLH